MNEKKILKDTRNRITKEKETENVAEEDVIFYVDVAPNGKHYKENIEILQKLHVAVENNKDKPFDQILNEYLNKK